MNYKIIADEKKLRDFIEWLPVLKPQETYYVALFARKKYAPESGLKADKCQLKRFTSNKEMLFDKIKQLECEIGTYKKENLIIPQEALALYINPNPRDFIQASEKSILELNKRRFADYDGYNPHQIVLDQIQVSCKRKVFYDFDFDKVLLGDVLSVIENKVNFDAIHVVHTRGGFHLLVEQEKVEKTFSKTWHQAIAKANGCDVRGDNLLPVVGCVQGGHIPHFWSTSDNRIYS